MQKNLHLICMLFFSQIHVLVGLNNIIKHSISYSVSKTRTVFMSNDNIDFLTKYKYYFKKDNYNNVIKK